MVLCAHYVSTSCVFGQCVLGGRWSVAGQGTVSPAGVGQAQGRKYSPGDWPQAQAASALEPVLPYSSSEVNQNLLDSALDRIGDKKIRSEDKKKGKENCASSGIFVSPLLPWS